MIETVEAAQQNEISVFWAEGERHDCGHPYTAVPQIQFFADKQKDNNKQGNKNSHRYCPGDMPVREPVYQEAVQDLRKEYMQFCSVEPVPGDKPPGFIQVWSQHPFTAVISNQKAAAAECKREYCHGIPG